MNKCTFRTTFFGVVSTIFMVMPCCACESARIINNSIERIDSFAEAAAALNAATTETLVCFDVDETLICQNTNHFSPRKNDAGECLDSLANLQCRKILRDRFEGKVTDWHISVKWKAQPPMLIEPSIVKKIQELQGRGVQVLAVTAIRTGAFCAIKSRQKWRYEKLKKLGMDFGKIDLPKKITFSELPERFDNHPKLYRGILCTNGIFKGEAITALLNRVQWEPDQVMLFDNSFMEVLSVEEKMIERSKPFYGYYYRGADFIQDTLDKELLTVKYDYLLEKGEWLSDDQARELLTPQK